MLAVMPSDPRYPALAMLYHALGVALNPSCWAIGLDPVPLPDAENRAVIAEIEKRIAAILDGGWTGEN